MGIAEACGWWREVSAELGRKSAQKRGKVSWRSVEKEFCRPQSPPAHSYSKPGPPSAGHSLVSPTHGRPFCTEPGVSNKQHSNFCKSGGEPPGCGRIRKTVDLLVRYHFCQPCCWESKWEEANVLQSPGLPGPGKCQLAVLVSGSSL